MTHEEMNIAIAEHFDKQTYCPDDYCGDLNLMHEAESSLDDEPWLRYRAELFDLMPKSFALPDCDRSSIHATAAQRAEAFLKTIGKFTH